MKKVLLFFYLPLFTLNTNAQVPVSKEPRHHVVFENEKVRLLNVLLPPGDTTQYHVHSTPSVFICFTKTNTTSQLIHQQPVQGTSNAGYVWFENLKPPHIKTHRVWNQDIDTFHVMDVEVLSNDSGFTQKPILLPHTQLTINTPWARTYKIELKKFEKVVIEEHPSALMLVGINNGMITMIKKGARNNLAFQAGTFFWMKPDEQFTLLNKSETVMHFSLVEIR